MGIEWVHQTSTFNFYHNRYCFYSFEVDVNVQPVEKYLYPTLQISYTTECAIQTDLWGLLSSSISPCNEESFSQEIRQLEEMGFKKQFIILALQQTCGNLENALSILIANHEQF